MTYPETHRTLYSNLVPGCDDEGEVHHIDREMPVDHLGVDMRGGLMEPSESGDVSDSDDNDDMVFEMDGGDLNGRHDESGDAPPVQSPQTSHHRAASHSYSQMRMPPLQRRGQGHNRSRSSFGAASSIATPTTSRTAMSPPQRPGTHRTATFPLSVPTHAAIAQPVVVPLSPPPSTVHVTGGDPFMGSQHGSLVSDTRVFASASARANEMQQSQFHASHSAGSNVRISPGPIPIPPPHSSSPQQQVQPHYPPGEVLHPHHPQHSRYFQSGSGSQSSQSPSAGRSLSRSSASRHRPTPSRPVTTPNTSLPPFADHESQAYWPTNMVLSIAETVGIDPAELVNPCVSTPCGVQVGDKASDHLLDTLKQPMTPMTPVLDRSTAVALQSQEAWKEQQQMQTQVTQPLHLNNQEYVERKADEIKRQQENLVSQRREEEEELAQSQTGPSDSGILYESSMAVQKEMGAKRAPFQPFHQQVQQVPSALSLASHNTPLQEKLRAGIQKRTSAHLARERANTGAGGNFNVNANVNVSLSRGRPGGVSGIPGPASFAAPHPHPHSAPPSASPFGPPPPPSPLQPMQLPPVPALSLLPDSRPLPTLPLDFPYPPRGMPAVRQLMGPPPVPFTPSALAAPFVPSGQQAGFVADPTSQHHNQPVIAYGSKPYSSGYVPPADRNDLYRHYRHYTYQSQPGPSIPQQYPLQQPPASFQQFLQVPQMNQASQANQAMLPLQHHLNPQQRPMVPTVDLAPVQVQSSVVHDPPAGDSQGQLAQLDVAADSSMPDVSEPAVTSSDIAGSVPSPSPASPAQIQESPTPVSPPRPPQLSSPLVIRRQLSRRRGSAASAASVTSSGPVTGTNTSPPRILHPPRDPRALRATRAVRHPAGGRTAPSPAGQLNRGNPPAADEETLDTRSQSFFDHDEDDDDGDGTGEEEDGGSVSPFDDTSSPPTHAAPSPDTSAPMSVSTSVSTSMASAVATSTASSLPSSTGMNGTSQSAAAKGITLASSGTADSDQKHPSSSPHQPSSVENPALNTSNHSSLSTSATVLSHLPLRPQRHVPDARSLQDRRLADRVALEMTPIVPFSSAPPSVGKHPLEGGWSSHPTISSSTEDAETGEVAAVATHIEPLARRPDVIGANGDDPEVTNVEDGVIDSDAGVQQTVPAENVHVEPASQDVPTVVPSSSHATAAAAVTQASTSSHHACDYDSDYDPDDLLDLLDLPLTPIQIFLLRLPSSFWLSLLHLATLASYHHHCFLVARMIHAKRNPPPPRPPFALRPLPRWTWTCQCGRRHTVIIRPWAPIQLAIMAGPQWCDRCGDVEPVRGPDTVVWEPPAGPPGPPPPGPPPPGPPPPPGRPW